MRKVNRWKEMVLFAAAILFLMDARAESAIHVYQAGPISIQDAIDAASSGEEVVVHPGTYFENIDFAGKAIVVRSFSGPFNCTIDGSGSGSVVTFDNGEGSDSVLRGFTLINGFAMYGGGVYCGNNTSPVIYDCIISGNAATFGGGISSLYNASPVVNSCHITNNEATNHGGGIFCEGSPDLANPSGSPVIRNCRITQNRSISGSGGGIYSNKNMALYVSSCHMAFNEAGDKAGALYCSSHTVTVRKSRIMGNQASLGGGIYAADTGFLDLVNCIITDNAASWTGGGGIYCHHADPRIVNCTITRNYTQYYGGGMSLYGNSRAEVVNSILWGNEADSSPDDITIIDGQSELILHYSDVGVITNYGGAPVNLYQTFSDDPDFVNPAAGDYGLNFGSPCIDTGTDDTATYPFIPADDIEGDTRPQGAGYEVGADEFLVQIGPALNAGKARRF